MYILRVCKVVSNDCIPIGNDIVKYNVFAAICNALELMAHIGKNKIVCQIIQIDRAQSYIVAEITYNYFYDKLRQPLFNLAALRFGKFQCEKATYDLRSGEKIKSKITKSNKMHNGIEILGSAFSHFAGNEKLEHIKNRERECIFTSENLQLVINKTGIYDNFDKKMKLILPFSIFDLSTKVANTNGYERVKNFLKNKTTQNGTNGKT